MAYVKGIDTSKWQASKVDYAKAKANGYDFVYLRIGAGNVKDKCFENDYARAKNSGLKIGVYLYTYSFDIAGAKRDAQNVLKWLNGRALDMPIAYDVEDATQKGTSRKTINANMVQAFADAVKPYSCVLYTGESFFNTYFDKAKVTVPLWIAKYSTKQPNVGRDIWMWQYTSGAIASDFYTKALDRNYLMGTQAQERIDAPSIGTVPQRTLKRGMRGEDVKWLQWKLGISYDGIFGAQTEKSVKDFQRNNALVVDGIVGAKTLAKLKLK